MLSQYLIKSESWKNDVSIRVVTMSKLFTTGWRKFQFVNVLPIQSKDFHFAITKDDIRGLNYLLVASTSHCENQFILESTCGLERSNRERRSSITHPQWLITKVEYHISLIFFESRTKASFWIFRFPHTVGAYKHSLSIENRHNPKTSRNRNSPDSVARPIRRNWSVAFLERDLQLE